MIKNAISFVCCILVCAVLVQYRVANSDISPGKPSLKITTWDAFGYYMYLPSLLIYHDIKELKWVDSIDRKYAMTGGNGIPAVKESNGNYVDKYLGGVAILQLPFFAAGHWAAKHYGYPADGFSPPYQYALGFGIILYCFLAILALRKILLLYFSDLTTAITIIMVCLATNFVQYAAIDSAQSHAYIFPLYVLILYGTIKWHQKPSLGWAALCGYMIGLATICRPTEAIMLFIPLCWGMGSKEATREKWTLVRQYKSHIICAALFGFIGILPQLLYWKATSGHFIYDVGSKWQFLTPWFRVLFGWEKGWFIYTPITIFFITGLFFMKQMPFKKAVLWYCLLNIYIIISWDDWRYGGSYSTRALVQSYPLFALPFAAFTERIKQVKWRVVFYSLCTFMLCVNLFQVNQYNRSILHYNDMNRLYYSRIYLNPNPTPIDISLLDNPDFLRNERGYKSEVLLQTDSAIQVHFEGHNSATLINALNIGAYEGETWIKVYCIIKAPQHLWGNYLDAALQSGDSVKHTRIRLYSPLSKDERANEYAFYIKVPAQLNNGRLTLSVTGGNFVGTVESIRIIKLHK